MTFYQKYNMSDEIAKIEWNASYLLGVPEIDQQHKQRISIANELTTLPPATKTCTKLKCL